MHIGKQVVGRDVHNYEIGQREPDADLRRQLAEVVSLVEQAVRSRAVEGEEAADLRCATAEVTEAAAHPERGRLMRALKGLRHLSAAAAATAGIAEATETIIHSVAGT
jgi:hypothetical protein